MYGEAQKVIDIKYSPHSHFATHSHIATVFWPSHFATNFDTRLGINDKRYIFNRKIIKYFETNSKDLFRSK